MKAIYQAAVTVFHVCVAAVPVFWADAVFIVFCFPGSTDSSACSLVSTACSVHCRGCWSSLLCPCIYALISSLMFGPATTLPSGAVLPVSACRSSTSYVVITRVDLHGSTQLLGPQAISFSTCVQPLGKVPGGTDLSLISILLPPH